MPAPLIPHRSGQFIRILSIWSLDEMRPRTSQTKFHSVQYQLAHSIVGGGMYNCAFIKNVGPHMLMSHECTVSSELLNSVYIVPNVCARLYRIRSTIIIILCCEFLTGRAIKLQFALWFTIRRKNSFRALWFGGIWRHLKVLKDIWRHRESEIVGSLLVV